MSQYSLPGQRKLSFYDSPAMNPPGGKAENKPSERFTVHCYTGADTRIVKKVEQSPAGQIIWNYAYDAKGHLVEVKRNGLLAERYAYTAQGARSKDYRSWYNDSRNFSYDRQGRLTAAGDCRFTWSDSGSLRTSECNGKLTKYSYGDDTRLDAVVLPTEAKITYQYGKELLPVQVIRNGLPIMEFGWKHTLQLTRYMDIVNGILYVFKYFENGAPKQVAISGPEAVVSRLTGQPGAHLKLNIHVDQLGSIRQLDTTNGVVVKNVEYDSFGNVMHDSRPEFHFPLGFAGGLVDPFTGFTRFGYRDYDPTVGRFTAKDPLGDTGGDHDLYDYCVDDPVNGVDPSGLKVCYGRTDAAVPNKYIKLHQKVYVEGPNGHYGISYGTNGDDADLGISSPTDPGELKRGGKGGGIVYEDDGNIIGNPECFDTSPKEDEFAREYLRNQVDRVGEYSILGYSCRGYSQDTYKKFKSMIQERRRRGAEK